MLRCDKKYATQEESKDNRKETMSVQQRALRTRAAWPLFPFNFQALQAHAAETCHSRSN